MKNQGEIQGVLFSLYYISIPYCTSASFFLLLQIGSQRKVDVLPLPRLSTPFKKPVQTEVVVASCPFFVMEKGSLVQLAGDVQPKSNQHQLGKESCCTHLATWGSTWFGWQLIDRGGNSWSLCWENIPKLSTTLYEHFVRINICENQAPDVIFN